MAAAIFICHIDLTASYSPMHTVLMKSHRWLRKQCCLLLHLPFFSLYISIHPSIHPCANLLFPLLSFHCHHSSCLLNLSFLPPSHLLPFLSRGFHAHGPNSIIDQIKEMLLNSQNRWKRTHNCQTRVRGTDSLLSALHKINHKYQSAERSDRVLSFTTVSGWYRGPRCCL